MRKNGSAKFSAMGTFAYRLRSTGTDLHEDLVQLLERKCATLLRLG